MMFDKENVWYDSKTRDKPLLLGNLLGKELLVCPLCHEYYKDPRLLPCAHTFCRGCLQTYHDKRQNELHSSQRLKTMPCPKCQMEVVVPSSGVSGYQLDDKVRQKKEEFISALRRDTVNPTLLHETNSDPGVTPPSSERSSGRYSHGSPRLSDLYNEARGQKPQEKSAGDTPTSSHYRLSQDRYMRPGGDYAETEYRSRTKPRNNVQRSSSLRDKQQRTSRAGVNFRDDHGFNRSDSRTPRETSRDRAQPNVQETTPDGPEGFTYTPPAFESTRAARFASKRLRRAPSPAGGHRNSYMEGQETPGQPKMSSWSSNESLSSSHSYGPTSTASEPNGYQKPPATQEERYANLLEKYGRRASEANVGQSGNSQSPGDPACSPRSDRTSSFSASPFTSPSTPSAEYVTPPNGVTPETPDSPIPPSRRSTSMRRRKKDSETEVPPTRDIPRQDSLERKSPPNLKDKLAERETRSRSNSRTDVGSQEEAGTPDDQPKKDPPDTGLRRKKSVTSEPVSLSAESAERPSRKADRNKRPSDLKDLGSTNKPTRKISPLSPSKITAWEALSGGKPLTRQGSQRGSGRTTSPLQSPKTPKGTTDAPKSPKRSVDSSSPKNSKSSSRSDSSTKSAARSVPKSPTKSPKESSFPWKKATPKTDESANKDNKKTDTVTEKDQDKIGLDSERKNTNIRSKESRNTSPTKNTRGSLPTDDKSEAIKSEHDDCIRDTRIPSKPERIIQGSSDPLRNETNTKTNVPESPAPKDTIRLNQSRVDSAKLGEAKQKTGAKKETVSSARLRTVTTREDKQSNDNSGGSSKLHDTFGGSEIDKGRDKCGSEDRAEASTSRPTPVVNAPRGAAVKGHVGQQRAAAENGSGDHNRAPDNLKGAATNTELNANNAAGEPRDFAPAESVADTPTAAAATNCDSNVTPSGQESKAAIHDDDDDGSGLNSSPLQQDSHTDDGGPDANTEESSHQNITVSGRVAAGRTGSTCSPSASLAAPGAQQGGGREDGMEGEPAPGSLYRTREVWKLERHEYEMPTSVVVTGSGTSVLADYSGGNLQYFDSSGQLTHIVKGVKPFCLATNLANHVIVADRRLRTVRVFDEHGADVAQWEDDMFKWIAGLAATSQGQFVVYDREFCRVGVYSSGGQRLSEFGAYGTRDTQLCMADFVTVDNNDRIIMCDSGNHCIKVFDTNGDCLLKFGTRGQLDGQLEWPKGICVDSENNIIVADYCNRRISLFSPMGDFIQHLLTNWPNPYSVCFREPNMLGVTHYSLSGYSKVGLYTLESLVESTQSHNGQNGEDSTEDSCQ